MNKWPGNGALNKITAINPPNHNMETLEFYLTAKEIFSRGSLKLIALNMAT